MFEFEAFLFFTSLFLLLELGELLKLGLLSL
jgi:hypothetical protein